MTKCSGALLLCCAAILNGSCGRVGAPGPEPATVWRKLGAWSGHGPTQTEPFISETGSLRVRWETRAVDPPVPTVGTDVMAAGPGRFRVVVHSDVSGRSLGTAVETSGAGHDTVFFSEDPRPFFLDVQSELLEWTLAVEEPVATTHRHP